MEDMYSRSRLLVGDKALEKIKGATVAVLGLGGVGGYVAETLARSGVGHLILIDGDRYNASNLNRQIFALRSTLGRLKAEAAAERLRDINPDIRITACPVFYTPDTAKDLPLDEADYIADAIDMVTSKLHLIEKAHALGIPVISAMGAGNKKDPSQVTLSDISKTKICPLARVMRKELRKRGISHLKVVYSLEDAVKPETDGAETARTRVTLDEDGKITSWARTVGSMAFVPAAVGIKMAAEIIRDLAAGAEAEAEAETENGKQG